MRVFEYGTENREVFALFQCAVEPWWVFEASAKAMARDYHVFLFNADGHDEQGTDFVSIERSAEEAAAYFRDKGIRQIDVMYGVSMGGATVIRLLATQAIPVKKAIIDAGITPYPYPKAVCRLIAAWDFLTVSLATKNDRIMKLAAPPERWTPKGEDPEEHFERSSTLRKTTSPRKAFTTSFGQPTIIPCPSRSQRWTRRSNTGTEKKRSGRERTILPTPAGHFPKPLSGSLRGLRTRSWC